MKPGKPWLLGLTVRVCLVAGGGAALTAQAPAKPAGDGLLRSELSLGGRTATIAYAPGQKMSSSPASGKARDKIAQLEITGSLRIGTIELTASAPATTPSGSAAVPGQPPPVTRYTLWLESSPNEWVLFVNDASDASVGNLSLDRQAARSAPPSFAAALTAESFTSARLVLRWAGFEASAPVEFVDPLLRRLTETPTPNQTINRRHDDDTSALSRARLLQLRNETALVSPKGARVSISFQRSFTASPPRSPRSRGLTVDRIDFSRLASTPAGAIVMLAESPVPRLRTEVPLRFGKTAIATGNQVIGFPGSYGLWLKRVSSGWRLVFNHEPDAWGSQHDAQQDAAEIDLVHTEGHAASRPFAVNLIPEAPDRGRLVILWGPHEWSADFNY